MKISKFQKLNRAEKKYSMHQILKSKLCIRYFFTKKGRKQDKKIPSEVSEKFKVWDFVSDRVGYVAKFLIFLVRNAFDWLRVGYDLDSHIYIPVLILDKYSSLTKEVCKFD